MLILPTRHLKRWVDLRLSMRTPKKHPERILRRLCRQTLAVVSDFPRVRFEYALTPVTMLPVRCLQEPLNADRELQRSRQY